MTRTPPYKIIGSLTILLGIFIFIILEDNKDKITEWREMKVLEKTVLENIDHAKQSIARSELTFQKKDNPIPAVDKTRLAMQIDHLLRKNNAYHYRIAFLDTKKTSGSAILPIHIELKGYLPFFSSLLSDFLDNSPAILIDQFSLKNDVDQNTVVNLTAGVLC